ncbi:MAG: universal stress protein [Anaerolineae bacterium]|nr:universal stress protein [Phycisphaerae bacterium]
MSDWLSIGDSTLPRSSFVSACAPKCPIEPLPEGDPADVTVSTAKLCDADPIVIGTDRRGRLAHFLLGSTADSVIRRARCPVLVVRRDRKQLTSGEQLPAGAVA